MPKFIIPVVRIGYGYKDIEVEANSQKEAEELALDTAGDLEWTDKESNYELQNKPACKSSGELEDIKSDYRSLVLISYQSKLDNLIEAYVQSVQSENTSDAHIGVQTETEGSIELKKGILFSEPLDNDDGNLLEFISSFNTNGETVNVRTEGNDTEVKLDELTEMQLIYIIVEMEYYIEHPEEIDIR